MTAPVESRWYAQLVAPVEAPLHAAWASIGAEAAATPRAGLGGALVLQIASAYGKRRPRRLRRAAVSAVELYNDRVHRPVPEPAEAARLLRDDALPRYRNWEQAWEAEEALCLRVVDRLLGESAEVVDAPVPEAVLFMRACVAAGVVLGNVDDTLHADLDRCATWIGLAWEATNGELRKAGWRASLDEIGAEETRLPLDPAGVAHREALAAVNALPPSSLRATLLEGLVTGIRVELTAPRQQTAWQPMAVPQLSPRHGDTNGGPWEAFGQTWGARLENALANAVASGSKRLSGASDFVLSQGGKRMRPVLTLAVAEGCGASPVRALDAAALVEWLHQASLIVDDIFDDATLRRGQPALYAITSKSFAAGASAFYVGQVLRALRGVHPAIRRSIVQAGIGLVEGERLELLQTGNPHLDLTTYYRIIEGKTARLFQCAAAVGAVCADAPHETQAAIGRTGREIGFAFQIVDDLLDYVGDQATLGKTPGTDLREKKVTLPLLLLRERLTDRERLDAAFNEGDFDWLRAQLLEHDIPDACRARASRHLEEARQGVSKLHPCAGRDAIAAILEEGWQRRW